MNTITFRGDFFRKQREGQSRNCLGFDPMKSKNDVLIDLYFPRLKAIFENYRKRNEAFIVNEDTATFQRDQTDFQKDALQIVQASKDFKREIARLLHELERYPLE
jgi:hypothetical protein